MKGAPIQFRIRANEEGTTVSIVDGYYLDCIFHHNKNLASKYFHLISQQLSTNITSRERSLYEAKVGFTMSSKKHSSSKIDTSLDDTETYLKKEESNEKEEPIEKSRKKKPKDNGDNGDNNEEN